MSSSPFPYTCELCGAEGLTDEGMRSHTLEAHVAGRPDCPFCDCTVPQPQLVGHVQRAHLHYLTPERELMAFIDDQSPSIDEDSKMTTTDSCSYNTPGSINGWHSPDTTSYHNGAISKNYYNGFQDKDNYREKDEEKYSRSPKNINLTNGLKNVNINNTIKKQCSRDNSADREFINGHDKKGTHPNSNHNSNDNSPNKNKLTMASAGQGSPLRSQLALKLKSNTPKKNAPIPSPIVQCLLCDFTSKCPRKLEEHINRAHFDLTSPSLLGNANDNSNIPDNATLGLNNPTLTLDNPTLALSAMAMSPGPHSSSYQCPICESEFTNGSDVEVHVNVEHRDILSPQKSDQADNASCDDIVMMEESPVSNCPVCCQPLPLSQHELIQHIEEHFERGEDSASDTLSIAEREAQRNREEHEFQLLRNDRFNEANSSQEICENGRYPTGCMLEAQYGMEEDEEGYTSRAASSLKRAVYSGALSVAGYYERSVGLKRASAQGLDAGCSKTNGILERIAQLNAQNPSIVKTYLCSAVDHYASTYGDRGWGCGYRNMQMLLSSLSRHPPYAARLCEGAPAAPAAGGPGAPPNHGGPGPQANQGAPGVPSVPSIPSLQLLVERAWQMGFDTQGSEQLGCKLHNTRKWIGACEVVTVLSSLRIRCQLIDFHKPTAADGSHPALFDYVLRYFTHEPAAFKPPLYLQHQGHSRTIIGYEKHKDGKATLLVLDPSHSPAQVRQVSVGPWSSAAGALRLLRRGAAALRARQYQLLCVDGLLSCEQDYQASKVLQSVRVP